MFILLGIPFEELFDASKFPEIELGKEKNTEIDGIEDIEKFLKTFDRKLDEIIRQNMHPKAKSYTERYFEVALFLPMIKTCFLDTYNTPEEKGFSQPISSVHKDDCLDKEVYAYEWRFLNFIIPLVHKNSKIHPLFAQMKAHSNEDIRFGRLLSPLFILSVFFSLLDSFITQGLRTKKIIFWPYDTNNSSGDGPGKSTWSDGDIFFTFAHDEEPKLDRTIKKYCEASSKRLFHILKLILDADINPDQKICIHYENLLCEFFEKMIDMFEKQVPITKSFFSILSSQMKRTKFEDKLASMFVPGAEFSCYITKEHIETLRDFTMKLEDAQIYLEPYFIDRKRRRYHTDG